MTPLGPVVTGVQPGSIGTVVVVVVGANVVEGIAVVDEMEDPRLVLAPEQEASSNEASIDMTRTVRVARTHGFRRITASATVDAVLPSSEIAVVGAVLVLSVWSNRSEKRALASPCSWRRWRPGALQSQPHLSAWLMRFNESGSPCRTPKANFGTIRPAMAKRPQIRARRHP